MKLSVTHIAVVAAVLAGGVLGAIALCVALIFLNWKAADKTLAEVPQTPVSEQPEQLNADDLEFREKLKEVADQAARLANAIDNQGRFTKVEPANFAVGVVGEVPDKVNGRIVQIVSDTGMLVQFRGQLVAVRGVDTTGLTDDTAWPLSGHVIEIPNTIRYTTTSGGSRQVFLVDVIPDDMVKLARQIASDRMPASSQDKQYTPQQSAN